jgi:PAS domain S-box-containing protein
VARSIKHTPARITDPEAARLRPIRSGVFATLAVLAALCVGVAGVWSCARWVIEQQTRQGLLRLAQLTATTVDPARHEQIRAPEQIDTPEYQQAIGPLKRALAAAGDVRFIYTFVRSGEDIRFILDASEPGDADHDGVEDRAGVWEKYDSPQAEQFLALDGQPAVTKQIEHDRWGAFLSAFAPIRDQGGRVIGAVGVDLNADQFEAQLARIDRWALYGFSPAAVLSVMLGVLVWKTRTRLARDIIARRQAQEELARIAAQQKLLLDGITDHAIYMLDADGMVATWNGGAQRLKGYAPEEIIGRHLSTFYPPEAVLAGEPWALLARALREPVVNVERQRVRKDGTRFWAQVSLSPIRDASGRLLGFSKITRDVTERHTAQERLDAYVLDLAVANQRLTELTRQLELRATELEQARKIAEEAGRAKSAFVANISHELRTPLTAILGYADLLRADGAIAPTHAEPAEAIERAGRHLLQLINDVLDHAKLDAGQMRVELIDADPREVLLDAKSLLSGQARAKGLEFNLEGVEHLPPRITTDPHRLRQVIINLAGNAIKFTSSGSVRVVVRSRSADRVPSGHSPASAGLTIDIVDTGIGMDPETVTRLFQPFMQGDESMTRRFGGTGLGLTISLGLVEAMGGSISIASRVGEGSTFTISLPLGSPASSDGPTKVTAHGPDGTASAQSPPARENTPAPPSTPTTEPTRRERGDAHAQASSSSAGPLSGLSVLVADDGPDNQRLLKMILARAGARVELATDGRQAVDMALSRQRAGHGFDIILMDMQMPVLDGYEATRRLISQGVLAPIVALTAHNEQSMRGRCLEAGCADFLGKPFDRAALLAMVASLGRAAQASAPERRAAS